ncbi:amidohydrolase family protein [Kribbella deserti]|uniref:Amidohydrolase family protein n=1 Tax=Kribbella deserti TaxID=1926257 RepID=A0ABV6QV15_9ACTN
MTNQPKSSGLARRQFLAATTAAAGAVVVTGGPLLNPPRANATLAGAAGRTVTALIHATVIDIDTGRRLRDHTVLLSGDRITAVGREVRIPRGARVIDLTGKYVVPGLADMHAHALSTERVDLPLHLANGVTTIRIMSGNAMVYDWRDRVDAGSLTGPRMVVGSQIVDGDPTLWDPNLLPAVVVTDEASARDAVRRLKDEGADFIKVYSRVSPVAHRAILDEARRLGLTVAGHAPDAVPVTTVSDLGQRSLEHLHGVAWAVSSREREVRRLVEAIRVQTGDYNSWFRQIHAPEWLAANTFSPARASAVFATLKANRTRVVPTLTMHRVLDMPDTALPDPSLLRYQSADTTGTFDWVLENLYKANRPADEIAHQQQMWEYRQQFAGELFRVGVPVLAGTDTGTPYSVPGFALHEELALLVQSGATPLQALQAATREPARFLGQQAGKVAAGKLADLVVLAADPLADIRNTRRIDSVIAAGRLIDSAERLRMLADVEAAVQEPGQATAAVGCCGGRPSTHK